MGEMNERKKWITESKIRCQRLGLDPNKPRITNFLFHSEFKRRERLNDILIRSALPYMQMCGETFKPCGSILVLTDKEGYILKAHGPEFILRQKTKIGLGEGSSLREEDAGTNAVALAIRYKKPVYVVGKEYYLKIFQSGACFCAPILLNGELLGTITIVHPEKKGHPHTFTLIKVLAKLIEEEYKNLREGDFLISVVNSINITGVATYRDGVVKWLTNKAKDLLKIDRDRNILENFDQRILMDGELLNEIIDSERLEKSFLVVRGEYNDGFLFIFEPISKNLPEETTIKYIGAPYTLDDIVGLEGIKTQARRLAHQDVNLLIIGESGTGKELLASAIHNISLRAGEKFVVVNCAAMPETLFESELFGHKKGAFTGAHNDKIGRIEYADKGTLFLDEVGELSSEIQVKLLRVLEDKKVIPLGSNEARVVDVRFIFATNRDLGALVKEGKFREDLYYRICSPVIKIPPLRERKEEIPSLIDRLFLKIKDKHKGFVGGLTEQAKRVLMEYDFPGNVRELEKILEQAFLLCNKEYIDVEDLKLKSIEPTSIEEKVRQYKAKLIYEYFLINGRDIKKTCEELKLSERQVYRYLKEIKENKNY
uniref:Sigma-54-dependent Fis family transcriptional regulator n=1 Tax=candidate division WOR-3 bacterium TaxID=2052148 RepID=A0A7C4TBV4_UNCW3